MHYEINVSKNGKHYFATDERSLRDGNTIQKIAQDFVKRFPKSEGFEVTLARIEIGIYRETIQKEN